MIDPAHSLAFSIQANPGVYAVLVGSGVSRSAKIPTGWDITLDLVRKLAQLCDETCEPDPARWYQSKFEKEADYSDLLDELAKTPAERQQLLRGYWEPNDREREEGEKQPTAAHRAIAALAAQGFIRVILTTNFDRLVETALTDEGVAPTILSSPDQVQGALPLIHTRCCVFKMHGDYLDTRIRNTPAELDGYPPEFDQLLDRIFDEFGLIVCGWSAEWDGALRNAIYRAPSRRFTTYWAARGDPGDEAQRLIGHRGAELVPIEDAAAFFQNVQQYVESLEEFSRPHPLSTEAAVASLKRYISESKYRIQLSNLIGQAVERVVGATSGEAFALQDGPEPTSESVRARVRSYEAACSTLLAMAPIGSFWAEEEHYRVWQRALQRLSSQTSSNGIPMWLELKLYPAILLLYALGIGAVEADRLQFLKRMLITTLRGENQEDLHVIKILPPSCRFQMYRKGAQVMKMLEGMDTRAVPLNDWIHKALWRHVERIIPDNDRYTFVFDKLEILIALSYAHHKGKWSLDRNSLEGYWVPSGAFVYRSENRNSILQEVRESLSRKKDESPFVTCGIFGETAEACERGLKALDGFVSRFSWAR